MTEISVKNAHDITLLSAVEVSELFKSGELSAREITQTYLNRIAEVDVDINAFVELSPELAFNAADTLDKKRAAGEELGALAAAPLGIKDNIQLVGTKMTCASKMLQNFHSVFDATSARKALDAGMIPLGKLNLDEFAFGASTETSVFGVTHNPWDLTRVPGGSSGGSAAALASHQVALAFGSDTGGSIRQPAAFNGIVGLKPTYGRISRYGCTSFASSLDQIGPMTKTVGDNALFLNAIAGHDERDSTSVETTEDFSLALDQGVKGMRVGIASELMEMALLNPEIRAAVVEAAKTLEAQGAIVDDITLPYSEYAFSIYSVIAPAEAASNMARLDGMRYGHRSELSEDVHDLYMKSRSEGFGDEVKRRNILGTFMVSLGQNETYRVQAQKLRRMIFDDYKRVFSTHDLILTPASLNTAFKIGEKAESAVEMYLSDIYTIPVNLAGNVGLAMPAGLSSEGLPIGIQLIADHFQEAKAYAAAAVLEDHFGLLSIEK